MYPCTLLCLLTYWQERVYPHTIALPTLTHTGKKECTPALFSACLLTGKKDCTPTLLLSRLLLILERKSVPLHSSLPAYLLARKSVPPHYCSPESNSYWKERVYPCTLLCLLTNWQERVYPHTIALPILLTLERKSVPLHSSLPTINWQKRVYPCTLLFPILTGQKECTPTLFLSRYTGRKECTPTLFPPSNTRALTFVYPHTILTPNFPSNTGRKECTPTLFPAS